MTCMSCVGKVATAIQKVDFVSDYGFFTRGFGAVFRLKTATRPIS